VPYTVEALRSFGSATVVVETSDGSFRGRLATECLTERAMLAMLFIDGGNPSEPLCLHLESIDRVDLAPEV
jgi:hypothetical protein